MNCSLIGSHSQIARNLRTILSSKPDSSDDPAAHDRIHILWGEHHNIDDDPDDRITVDLLLEMKDPSDDLLNLPEIPEARAYLFDSVEYKWLLSRILVVIHTMPTLSTAANVRRELLEAIRGRGPIGAGYGSPATIRIEIEWHFPTFVEAQYERPEQVELQHVLCCSGLVDNAYVAPCIEHVELLWPWLGKEAVLCLSRSLRRESIKKSGVFSLSSSN